MRAQGSLLKLRKEALDSSSFSLCAVCTMSSMSNDLLLFKSFIWNVLASSRLCKSTREQSYFVWVVSYTEVPVDQVIDKFPFFMGGTNILVGAAPRRE